MYIYIYILSKIIKSSVTKVLKSYFSRVNHAYFYPKQKVSIEVTTDMCACGILKTMIFDIGVQLYSNINGIINFHIDMTQPDKTKVLPDKLLTDKINKQFNINTTTDSASNNENVVTMHESNKNVYPDVDCHLVRDGMLSLLNLHLTNVDISNTSEDQQFN